MGGGAEEKGNSAPPGIGMLVKGENYFIPIFRALKTPIVIGITIF
jgi:hypothetical protein